MRLNRWTQSSVLASLALLPLPFVSANAVERSLFTWSSTVDKEVVIQVHGRDVATRGSGMDATFSPRWNLSQPLPRTSGVIRVHVENGRGDVEVLENPSARNDYTATIRIRDSRGGAGQYRLAVTFDSDGDRDGNRGNGDYDRGNGRGGYDPRDNNGNGRGGYDPRDNSGNGRGGYDPRDDHRNDHGWYDRSRRDAGALRWSGRVDGVAEIRIQGNRIESSSRQGQRLRDVRFDVLGSALPRRDVRVELAGDVGRGSVQVVQQPSMRNGYAAVIRIEDRRGGYGSYDFDVRW
ncbi:MAG: hypothetical protein ABJC26_14580 [Gemmatimonadaceae bacterium]